MTCRAAGRISGVPVLGVLEQCLYCQTGYKAVCMSDCEPGGYKRLILIAIVPAVASCFSLLGIGLSGLWGNPKPYAETFLSFCSALGEVPAQ